jgi:site-specific DNA recombinase
VTQNNAGPTDGERLVAVASTRRPRASLYARLSRRADGTNVSLEGMAADMRALCDREGLEEIALHIDDGASGGRRDRDGFDNWLNDARTGACDVLVPYNTDRLTREGLNVAARILDAIEGKDPSTGRPLHRPVRLVDCFALDSRDGDAFRFRLVIQAEVGRAERELTRQRNRDRDRRVRLAGRWSGGPVSYGYKAADNPDGPGKILVVNQEEAAVIRAIADAVLGPESDSLALVARRLNHAGIKPRRAARWSRNTLAQLVTSDHVLGRVKVRDDFLRDGEGAIAAPFPSILNLGQVTALRAKLGPQRAKGQGQRGSRLPSRLLSGLLECHSCGTALEVDRRAGRIAVYRCPAGRRGWVCEQPVSVSALAIEKYVEGLYLTTVGHLPMYEERTIVTGVEEMAAVEEDLTATLADLATEATPEAFERLQQLQARQRELSDLDPTKRTELVPTCQTVADFWEGAVVDDRRNLLDDAFEELTVLPGRKGPRGFDHNRLRRRWAQKPEAGDEEHPTPVSLILGGAGCHS